MTDTPVVELRHVTKTFHSGHRLRGGHTRTRALRDFSLRVAHREVVALVGESGAGKTTAGRVALGQERPDDGTVLFEGAELATLSARQRRDIRRRTHFILQDPYQSLHPAMSIRRIVAEPLAITGVPRGERLDRVVAALEEVRLTPAGQFLDRYPHQLSGGQRQRVAFARALVGEPRLIVADEPVSMLDVSLQAGILELITQMSDRHGIVFITHDLAVARQVASRIAVMYGGRLIESGGADAVIDAPLHPYTAALLDAAEHLTAPPAELGPFPPGGQPCEQYGHCDPSSAACRDAELVLREAAPSHYCAWHTASPS